MPEYKRLIVSSQCGVNIRNSGDHKKVLNMATDCINKLELGFESTDFVIEAVNAIPLGDVVVMLTVGKKKIERIHE